MRTIVLDAAHGGTAPAGKSTPYGGRGPGGLAEKSATLDFCRQVAADLGDRAVLTRSGDTNLTLAERIDAARQADADGFVSVHFREPGSGRGPAIWLHDRAGEPSVALATQLGSSLGAPVSRAPLAVLDPERHQGRAACVIEVDELGGSTRFGDAARATGAGLRRFLYRGGKPVAVILVPAIGGSNVANDNHTKGFGADLTKVMVGILASRAKGDNWGVAEALAEAGKWAPLARTPNTKDVQEQRGWKQVASGVYLPWLKALSAETGLGFTPEVYCIGYNFLRSNAESAGTVLARTREIMSANKDYEGYLFVTHSMGALPTRLALKRLSEVKSEGAQELYRQCLGVVHVAPPNLGAPEAYRRLYGGLGTGTFGLPDAVSLVLGKDGVAFSTTASVMPSFLELLPVPAYASHVFPQKGVDRPAFPSAVDTVTAVLSGQKYAKDAVAAVTANEKLAKTFWDELGDWTHPRTAAIVLEGLKTTVAMDYVGKTSSSGGMKFEVTTTTEGDGTVPVDSQKAHIQQEAMAKVIKGIEHSVPLTDAGKAKVWPALLQLLDVLHRMGVGGYELIAD